MLNCLPEFNLGLGKCLDIFNVIMMMMAGVKWPFSEETALYFLPDEFFFSIILPLSV